MGEVAPAVEDDGTIPNAVELWRRVPYRHWVPDAAAPTGRRLSSAAFDDPEMSVVIADECTGGESTLLRGHDGFGIARFTAGDVRALGWGVVRAPDDELPGHAHVLGRKTLGGCRKLARRCRVSPEPQVA